MIKNIDVHTKNGQVRMYSNVQGELMATVDHDMLVVRQATEDDHVVSQFYPLAHVDHFEMIELIDTDLAPVEHLPVEDQGFGVA
jgi:hypothetical protein